MKPFREPNMIKPVIKVALEVADEYLNGSAYEAVDVFTRLRAAICLAEEAGLSTQDLLEKELLVQSYGQR